MGIITEHFQFKRLKNFGINIKTKFQDGKNVCERNSDNSYNEDVQKGVILNKTYFLSGKPIYMESNYNPSILYSFVMREQVNSDIICDNCGKRGKGEEFINGCPYCGSIYTVDYSSKNLGSKFNYDYVMRDDKYKLKVFVKDFICCLILSSIYCISTGRTFNFLDVFKIFLFALIGSLLFFYVFYTIDTYNVTNRVIKEKEKKHKKQIKFWNDISQYDVSKEKFFNNLNNELREFFYDDSKEENKNVIDFDVLDYDDYEYFIDEQKRLNIKVKLHIRILEFVSNQINSDTKNIEVTLVQNEIKEHEEKVGIYIAKCYGCGASIDVMKDRCEYCGRKIHYLQNWYIVRVKG